MRRSGICKSVRLQLVLWSALPIILFFGCAGRHCDIGSSTDGGKVVQAGASRAPQVPTSQEVLFDYRETFLDNGLRVITLEDFSCPIVTVQVWYHVGSKDEQPDRQGFAHMFEHMMFRGTDRLGPIDHFELVRRTGGTNNAYTSFDRTVYHQTLPASQLELALWLEAERMTFLDITQDNFDTERKVVEEERRIQLNRPYGTVNEKVLAELFKLHPYRWPVIGNIAHLRAATVKELRDFWTRYYVPNNAALVIVGAVSHQHAQRQARRYFGWIPRYRQPGAFCLYEPAATAARCISLNDENAPAPMARLAWRTVPAAHKDAISLEFAAEVLGGGHSSRLYRDLVADRQLAVRADAYSSTMEQDGIFSASAVLPTRGSDPNQVLEIMTNHVVRLAAEPVSPRELTKARNQLLRQLVTSSLTIERKAGMLGNAAITEHDTSRANKQMAEIRAVTAQDLQRVVRTYLAPQRVLAVAVQQNLLEQLPASRQLEEQAAVTAKREQQAPPPGRPGLARPAAWPNRPPLAELKPARLTPAYSSTVLANGLKVLVVPNHEVPYVTVHLGLLAGSWTESKPGSTSMALGMLTKGTENFTEAELADELDTYAISLDGYAQMDTCSVAASCLTEHLNRAMNLLAEVVLRPTFPAEEFQKLRKQVLTSLAIASAEPDYIADRQLRCRLFGAHPYARTPRGEIPDVQALDLEDLHHWWRTFARPDMAALIFSGDVEKKEAVMLAEMYLGSWGASGERPDISPPEPPAPQTTSIFLVDLPASSQSKIRVACLGIARKDPDYFTSRLVSSYFGEAFNSRLNKAVRVEKGLTYGARGGFSAARFAGQFVAQTFTRTNSTAEALRTVLQQVEALQTQPPSAQELEHNRSYLLGSFIRNRQTPQDIAEDLWLIESHGLPADYFDKFLASIARTTTRDCSRFAGKSIDTSKLVVVVVGDAAKLKDELEQLAPVTVISAGQEQQKEATALSAISGAG